MAIVITKRTVVRALVALGAVLLLAGSFRWYAYAGEDGENPYVELYKLRVSQAEANLRRKQALSTLAVQKLDRGRRLLSSAAISREEYDTLVSDDAVARADVELAGQKVDESKAYLKIIQGLTARGVTIPLCTYEME